MVRSRENLHLIYIFLFLEAAFFLLQVQDGERYLEMFAFVPGRFFSGEIWRVITYQFMHGSALSLFFAMLILYIMGNALEEEWGSAGFVAFWALSVLGSAAVAVALAAPLIGSFFLSYSLLFAYAATYPEMTFYIFFVLPVKVKWLAWIALAILLIGIFTGSPTSIAAAGGAMLSMTWFWILHGRARYRAAPRPRAARAPAERPPIEGTDAGTADRNLALFDEVERTLRSDEIGARESLRRRIESTIVAGVNVCPPPDYKPLNPDRYCVRCEGFAECTARFMRLAEAEQLDHGAPRS